MRRSLILFYVCLTACLVFLSSCAGNRSAAGTSEQKHFFWKVSDENSSVWVLGSIHLADSTLYPLAPVIDSFGRSPMKILRCGCSEAFIWRIRLCTRLLL